MRHINLQSLTVKIALIVGTLSLSGGAVFAKSEEAMKPLEIELPKPLFSGTPKPMAKIPNLEQPRDDPREPIMVPKGTRNLAAGKPVTSSDDWPIIGELDFVTDGDKQGEEGYYVELGQEMQWVQIDLEEASSIHAIVVWHYHAEPRVYHDVIVEVSDDPEFKEGVTEVFNNDHDNSSGKGEGQDRAYIETNEGKLIEVDAVEGRYVRLYSSGNTSNEMNHYIEVEVYGEAASG